MFKTQFFSADSESDLMSEVNDWLTLHADNAVNIKETHYQVTFNSMVTSKHYFCIFYKDTNQ